MVHVTILQYAAGLLCALVGAAMLVIPHQFHTTAYEAFQPSLGLWSAVFLGAGGALLAAASLVTAPVVALLTHLLAAGALLVLGGGFVAVSAWPGAIAYTVLGLGVALAGVVVATGRVRPPDTAPDLFALVVGATAVLKGLLLLGPLGNRLGVLVAREASRPVVLACGVALLASGAAVLAAQLRPGAPRPLRRAAHVAVGGAFLTFALVANAVPERVWTGLMYYAGFAALTAVLPWLGPRLQAADPASLRTRLALTCAAAAALPLVAAVALVTDQEEATATAQALARQETVVTALAEDIGDYIALHRAGVVALAAQPDLIRMPEARQRRLLQSVRKAYPDAIVLSTYGSEGHPVARSDDRPLESMSGARLFDDARRSGLPSLEVRTDIAAGRQMLVLGAPLSDAEGRFAGLAAMALEAPSLADLIRRGRGGPDMTAYLLDDQGQVIAHASPRDLTAPEVHRAGWVDPLLRGVSVPGSLRYGAAGDDRLAAFAPVAGLDWSVVVEQPARIALGPVRQGREVAFVVLLAVVAAGAGLGAVAAGFLTAPVGALTTAVDRLTSGDVSAPLPRGGTSEVAVLSRAFGEMRERLVARETARQRAEAERNEVVRQLEAERTRFEAVLRQMPAGVLIAEAPSGRLRLYNEQAERIWAAPMPLATSIADYARFTGFHADGTPGEAGDSPIAHALRGESVADVDLDVVRGDGQRRTIRASAAPIRNRTGQVTAAVATFHDVTDAHEAQRRAAFLAEASGVLASSLDPHHALTTLARLAVPELGDWCAVDLLEPDGRIRRLLAVHADPAKEQLARAILERSPLKPTARDGVPAVLRTGQSRLYSDIPDRWLRGTGLTALGLKSALTVPLVARGRTLGALTLLMAESARRYGIEDLRFAEDVAQRAALAVDNARLYQQAQQADRRKDEFLAMLAHELRNPLAPIVNTLYVLERTLTGDPSALQRLAIIRRQTGQLARLVDDLLDVSRITSGKVVLRRHAVDLNEAARRSIDSLGAAGRTALHELQVTLAPEPLVVDGDPVRLEQVVGNLLDNAVKYSTAGTPIQLTTAREGREAVLRVRDHGVGIAPEVLPHIFDLFTQAEASLDRAGGGLGLGLALVRRLVQQHGGCVAATSAGRGAGSEFVVRLPLARRAAEEERRESGTGGPPLNVLVVEDSADARESLRAVLELAGHQVRAVGDGPSGVAAALARRPDIALIDIGLPGMDGYDVARQLRETNVGRSLPLVALTGYGQPADRARSEAVGFDAHLVKPIDGEQLLAALASLSAGR